MDQENSTPRKMTLDAYIERALKQIAIRRPGDRRQKPDNCVPPYLTQDGMVLIDRRSHVDRRVSRRG